MSVDYTGGKFLEPGAIQDYLEAIKYKVGNRVKWSAIYLQPYRDAWQAAGRDSEKSLALGEYLAMRAKRGTIEATTARGLKIMWDGNPLPHYCVDYLVTVVKE
jgi:hypothetical protein